MKFSCTDVAPTTIQARVRFFTTAGIRNTKRRGFPFTWVPGLSGPLRLGATWYRKRCQQTETAIRLYSSRGAW